jgi:hypothetical protein
MIIAYEKPTQATDAVATMLSHWDNVRLRQKFSLDHIMIDVRDILRLSVDG